MNRQANLEDNERYGAMRGRYGVARAQANGYRLQSFFRREQRIVWKALAGAPRPILDVACGSGLMLRGLPNEGRKPLGIDFNLDACFAASQNGMAIIRGNAFAMPLPDGAVGTIVNCQFLNQQNEQDTATFVGECARVLKPGGKLVLLWRHAESRLHVTAHALFSALDRLRGQPIFPQYTHSMTDMGRLVEQCGFSVSHKAVTLPAMGPDTIDPESGLAQLFGASLMIVAVKS